MNLIIVLKRSMKRALINFRDGGMICEVVVVRWDTRS